MADDRGRENGEKPKLGFADRAKARFNTAKKFIGTTASSASTVAQEAATKAQEQASRAREAARKKAKDVAANVIAPAAREAGRGLQAAAKTARGIAAQDDENERQKSERRHQRYVNGELRDAAADRKRQEAIEATRKKLAEAAKGVSGKVDALKTKASTKAEAAQAAGTQFATDARIAAERVKRDTALAAEAAKAKLATKAEAVKQTGAEKAEAIKTKAREIKTNAIDPAVTQTAEKAKRAAYKTGEVVKGAAAQKSKDEIEDDYKRKVERRIYWESEDEKADAWKKARDDFKEADQLDGAPDISSNFLRRGGQEPIEEGKRYMWKPEKGTKYYQNDLAIYRNMVDEFERSEYARDLPQLVEWLSQNEATQLYNPSDHDYPLFEVARGSRYFTELHEQVYQRKNRLQLYEDFEARAFSGTLPDLASTSDRVRLFSSENFDREKKKTIENVKGWGPSFLWPITAVGERNRQLNLLQQRKKFTSSDARDLATLEAADYREGIEKRRKVDLLKNPDKSITPILSDEQRQTLESLRTIRRLNTAEGRVALNEMARGLDIYKNDPTLKRPEALIDKLRLANRSKGWDREAQRTLLALESASLASQLGIETFDVTKGEGDLIFALRKLKTDNTGGLKGIRNWIRIAQDNRREVRRLEDLAEFNNRDRNPGVDVFVENEALRNQDLFDGPKRIKKMSWGSDEKALLAELEAGRDDLAVRGTEESEKQLKAFDARYGELLGALNTLKRRNSGMGRIIGLYHRVEDSLSNKKRTELRNAEAQKRAQERRLRQEAQAKADADKAAQDLQQTLNAEKASSTKSAETAPPTQTPYERAREARRLLEIQEAQVLEAIRQKEQKVNTP